MHLKRKNLMKLRALGAKFKPNTKSDQMIIYTVSSRKERTPT